MFIPLKDLNPRRSYPIVNTGLILANFVVFIYQFTLPPQAFKRLRDGERHGSGALPCVVRRPCPL